VADRPKKKPTILQGIVIVFIIIVAIGGIAIVVVILSTAISNDATERGRFENEIFMFIAVGGGLFGVYRLFSFISNRWNIEIK